MTADGIRQLVEGALALAKITEEDPFAGLPEAGEFGSVPDDLHLYYDDVYSLPGAERIEWARRAEAAALEADPRIVNSDGGSFDAATGRKVLANSARFCGRLSLQLCRGFGGSSGHGCERPDATRLLVVRRQAAG